MFHINFSPVLRSNTKLDKGLDANVTTHISDASIIQVQVVGDS